MHDRSPPSIIPTPRPPTFTPPTPTQGDALLPLLPSLLLRHAPSIPYPGVAAVPTSTLPPVLQVRDMYISIRLHL